MTREDLTLLAHPLRKRLIAELAMVGIAAEEIAPVIGRSASRVYKDIIKLGLTGLRNSRYKIIIE